MWTNICNNVWKERFNQVVAELQPEDPADIADLIHLMDVPLWNRIYRSLDIIKPMNLISEWCECFIQTTGLYYAYSKFKKLNKNKCGEYPIEVIYDYYRCLKPRFAEYDIDSWDLPYLYQVQHITKYVTAYYNLTRNDDPFYSQMENKWRSQYGCILFKNDLIVFLRHYDAITENIKRFTKRDILLDIDDIIKKKRDQLYYDYNNEIYKSAVGKLNICRDLKPLIYQHLRFISI